MFELSIASTTASVTSLVVAVPPTSGVRTPAPVTRSTALHEAARRFGLAEVIEHSAPRSRMRQRD